VVSRDDHLCQAALAYAGKLGWPVFPCKPGGKEPLTSRGFLDATTDPEQIRQWWDRFPDANIGIPTGQASGFDVLDIDEGGEEALTELEAQFGKLPETIEALTGGGGRHLLFRHREGVRNSTKKLPGLDVRGEGGYIVAAPSIHPNGREYSWELSSRPGEMEIAEWPSWLLEKLRVGTNGKPQTPAPAMEEEIPEGQRNETLTSLAGTMRRRGMVEDEISVALRAVNDRRCSPPLPDLEVKQIATSVARYEPGESTSRRVSERVADYPPTTQSMGAGRPVDQSASPYRGGRPPTGHYDRSTLATLRDQATPTRYLTDGIFYRPGVGLLAGAPGGGKTWLTLSLAVSVARGGRWLGHFACEQGAALLVMEEENDGAVVERMDLLLSGLGMNQEDGESLPIHYLIQQGVSLVTSDGNLDPELLRHVDEVKPALLVLDPFRRLHGLEENNSASMSHLFGLLRRLAAEQDCSILVVHHLRKRGELDEGVDRVRGSSDIAASVDTILEIGGQFGDQVVKHSKAKRGPSSGSWLVLGKVGGDGLSMRYVDSDVQSEMDRDALRQWLLDTLVSPHNLHQLHDKGKPLGYGKDRIRKMLEELLIEGQVQEEKGPRNSRVFALAHQSAEEARVPPTTTHEKEEREICAI
jgi:hypothetical protein